MPRKTVTFSCPVELLDRLEKIAESVYSRPEMIFATRTQQNRILCAMKLGLEQLEREAAKSELFPDHDHEVPKPSNGVVAVPDAEPSTPTDPPAEAA